jgi:hypothetical protein
VAHEWRLRAGLLLLLRAAAVVGELLRDRGVGGALGEQVMEFGVEGRDEEVVGLGHCCFVLQNWLFLEGTIDFLRMTQVNNISRVVMRSAIISRDKINAVRACSRREKNQTPHEFAETLSPRSTHFTKKNRKAGRIAQKPQCFSEEFAMRTCGGFVATVFDLEIRGIVAAACSGFPALRPCGRGIKPRALSAASRAMHVSQK